MPIWPSRDATLTIEPLPRSTIDGSAARQVWYAARQVGRDDRVPLVRLELEEAADLGPAGVVDEPVDPPEALDRLLDQALGLVAVARGRPRTPPPSPPASRTRASVSLGARPRPGGSGPRRVAPSAAALAATSAPIPRLLPVTSDDPARQGIAHQATLAGSRPAVSSAARIGARLRLADRQQRRAHDRRLDDAELAAARPWSARGSRAPARRTRPPRAAGSAPRSRAPRPSSPSSVSRYISTWSSVASVPNPISAPSAPITNDS